MRQTVVVARIGGVAANTIESLFAKWASVSQQGSFASKWPEEDCAEMDEFVRSLRANSKLPPILFFCEYLDLSLMGDILDKVLMTDVSRSSYRVWSNQCDLACHMLPDENSLSSHLAHMLGVHSGQEELCEEERWFARVLQEAVLSYQTLSPLAAIVIVRDILGTTRNHEEILESLNGVPRWLRKG